MPESRDPKAPQHLDLIGPALGAIGLAGITYALIAAGDGWSTTNTVSAMVSFAAIGGFVLNEIRSTYPMVPPAMFGNRQFVASNLVTLLVYAALAGVFFFLMIDLQVVAGFSPLLAGAALLP